MRPSIICLFLFLNFSGSVSAVYEFNPELQEAYRLILKLKVDSGEAVLEKQIIGGSQNGLVYLVANYGDFFRLMFAEDKALYVELRKNQAVRIGNINKLDKKSPYYKYILGEIYLQWAFVKIKYGNETDGAFDFIKAYRLLKDNEEKFPSFLLHKKSLGFLHVLLGSIPEKYKWLAQTLGFTTDQTLGLKELKAVTDTLNPFREEAIMLSEWLSYNVLKEKDTRPQALKTILDTENDNFLAMFLYASILKKAGYGELALQTVSQWGQRKGYLSIPYISYLKGGLYLQKGDYEAAIFSMKDFLSQYKGESFRKDAIYKISLAYRLLENGVESKKYLELVPEAGEANFEADKYAQKMALSKAVSDNRLLRARLYCDGGYLLEATRLLDGLSVNNFGLQADKTEFYYRKGRIFDLQNNKENAVNFYEKAIIQQKEAGYYFAPNACLHLGYIYMKKDTAKARMYFKKAMSYKNHEYKNSIDTKAKAGLNDIKPGK